ncbi:hypothetical protein [Nocardioides sp. WS12]|uniref:hypothetical protein n=1 Tax=Nocardioides sp. WS12 TaxID=2486272 RepID=UPI0015FBF3CD|nr:hypothetical protein [Nocardioides sp. WS12]
MANLPDFLAVTTPNPAAPIAQEDPKKQPLFLTAGNLTFPGVTVVAGSILNAVASDSGTTRAWATVVIALAFGGFITWLSYSDADSTKKKATDIFIGVVNTALLAISMYGVSSI